MSEGIPRIWPADRLTDDTSVEDRIHNAVLQERNRVEKIAEGIAVAAGRLRRGYGRLNPGIENFVESFEHAARELIRSRE